MDSNSVEGGPTVLTDDYDALISTTDFELLKRAWRSEKAAPEILRFESDLINRVREQIQLMEDTVEEKGAAGADPHSLSLYQMDIDRTLFLLRSYLRIRIQKIEKYMFHIQKTDELWNRLSTEEKNFTRRCTDDLKQHLEESVLSKLPENYQSVQKQSVISEEDDMGCCEIKFLGSTLSQNHSKTHLFYVEVKNISQAFNLKMDQLMTGRSSLRWRLVSSTSYVTNQ
ncbi:DNA replication complex GINS protein SLD5 isoform X2 [Lotus japonicus]|uniref:DNA replication complex GINS protein SLD5 isoform X2 n=1 Tax=Lotus japonicus TaxID=34305 RepID=UPI002590A105|nr:DNA replication complex GINS protein SLD5 isoform X2 [Lotus japonicus]